MKFEEIDASGEEAKYASVDHLFDPVEAPSVFRASLGDDEADVEVAESAMRGEIAAPSLEGMRETWQENDRTSGGWIRRLWSAVTRSTHRSN